MAMHKLPLASLLLAAFLTYGCSALLPTAKQETKSPWNSYSDVKLAFDKVVPGQTTPRQLKTLGFDLYSTPNVTTLNYLDIAVTTQTLKREELDAGLQACLSAKTHCVGYQLQPQRINNKRYGNFFLDILNFRRKTRQVGWQVKALFIVVEDVIVYKLWGGNPTILVESDIINPLGPLQDAGSGLAIRYIP